MKNSLRKFSIFIFILLIIINCNIKKDSDNFQDKADKSIEVFYNSNKQSYIEIIEIKENYSKIYITITYSNLKRTYIGKKINNTIIVERENDRELHIYKNGTVELRVYTVVNNGYQPEDIEWTFYKID